MTTSLLHKDLCKLSNNKIPNPYIFNFKQEAGPHTLFLLHAEWLFIPVKRWKSSQLSLYELKYYPTLASPFTKLLLFSSEILLTALLRLFLGLSPSLAELINLLTTFSTGRLSSTDWLPMELLRLTVLLLSSGCSVLPPIKPSFSMFTTFLGVPLSGALSEAALSLVWSLVCCFKLGFSVGASGSRARRLRRSCPFAFICISSNQYSYHFFRILRSKFITMLCWQENKSDTSEKRFVSMIK